MNDFVGRAIDSDSATTPTRRHWLLQTGTQLLAVGLAVGLSGCRDKGSSNGSSGASPPNAKSDEKAPASTATRYPIVACTTVGMVADLVREIGGDTLQVKQLMGAGVDPHLYKPTRDDTQAILAADIVFSNGLMLEGKMAELLSRSSRTRRTLAVADKIDLPKDIVGADAHHPDPHVWMDVSLWSQAAAAVAGELASFDPKHAGEYDERCKKLRGKLDALHAYGQKTIATIPEDRRVLITSHDAFRYFGRAYGLEVRAIQGISTESEAGLQRINQLVDLLVTRKIEAVFVESSVPQESIQALLEGARSRGQSVKIGGELYSDAMGEPSTYEGTYIGMMDHNLTTIARALGAKGVPERGFRSLD